MMGVSDVKKNPCCLDSVQHDIEVIESYLDGENVSNKPITPKSRRRFVPKWHARDTAQKRRPGTRQARRCDNLTYILGLSEQDEIENSSDMDYVELIEPGLSAFAELFMESEKMKMWNDFINSSEDDQQQIITGLREKQQFLADEEEREEVTLERQDSADSWVDLVDDNRTVHPAFTAEECYKRIDNNLRTFLRRRQLPWGTLEHLEEEVSSFFTEWPTSVFVSKLESSFQRMLLHALCQYLDLNSNSFYDGKGDRQTQIENHKCYFIRPQLPLAHFLEYKEGKH